MVSTSLNFDPRPIGPQASLMDTAALDFVADANDPLVSTRFPAPLVHCGTAQEFPLKTLSVIGGHGRPKHKVDKPQVNDLYKA